MPSISVVIPVYNTEVFIGKTVGSLLAQTLHDIEIVCVNDGSTDGSLGVLKSLAGNNSRVKIVDLERNQGVSVARNAGIDAASGEYVYFLDSDDWIDPDYLESMLFKARETGLDIVVNANYVKEYDDTSRNRNSGSFGFIDKEEGYYPPVILQSYYPPVIWTCLYRKKFLLDNNIRYPVVKGGAEDIYFTGLAYMLVKEVFVFRGPFHHYYQREGSLFHQNSNGIYYLESFKLLYDELLSRNIPLDGVKLFYAGPVIFDTKEKFDFTREFLSRIKPAVLADKKMYTGHDLMLIDVVTSCPDYKTYLSRHNPNISIEFVRQSIRAKALAARFKPQS